MGIKITIEKEIIEARRMSKYRTGKTRLTQVELERWAKEMEISKGTTELERKKHIDRGGSVERNAEN